MDPFRSLDAEGRLERCLRSTAAVEVVTTEDLCHSLVVIVKDDGQVIGDLSIRARDGEVPKLLRRVEGGAAKERVLYVDLSSWAAEPEGGLSPAFSLSSLNAGEAPAASAGVTGRAVTEVGSREGLADLFARAYAGVGFASCD